MKVTIGFNAEQHRFELSPVAEPGDFVEKFGGGDVFFDVPSDWKMNATHPDLLALVVVVVLHPFVGARLQVNLGVSARFKEACTKFLPYTCVFDGAEIECGRQSGKHPGLSFSGGVDSTAALAVMPEDTQLFFLDRVTSDGKAPTGLYVKDSAEVACRMVSDLGYAVHKIPTNLEYVRSPVGFPVDWASGAPAILLADYCDLSSISWGVVAESAYRVGHEYFIDFPKRTIFFRWDGLLRAVGLSLGAPVAGLSEVSTSLVVQKSRFAMVAQSCIRGLKGKPCMNCFKCFRKSMLDAALSGNEFEVETFERLIHFRGGEKIVLGLPVKHENVFRWIVENLRMRNSSPTWEMFLERLRTAPRNISWSTAWYSPSGSLIPEEYRNSGVEAIHRYVPSQTAVQRAEFEAWDLRPELGSVEMAAAVRGLSRAMRS